MSNHVRSTNECREQQLERLREALRLGVRQAERGELHELDSDEFKQVARSHLAELAKKKKN